MGVNAVRTAHNPPSPEMIRVCEQLGIVMLIEAFDSWSTAKTTWDYSRFFDAESDADITEMVNAARNSPAVMMWSIGNEIRGATVDVAQRLVSDIRAIDPTRPLVWGSDGYRGVPARGSTEDKIARLLDGVGLNYNTAASIDALHERYPTTFFFESESSSGTSTRGTYQDANSLNTGENYTPGKQATSSYDNNLASWTMSGEYSLKKDRDRPYLAGEFLWSGFDYIGEPTPFDSFPVKTSFFGAVDTAGLPKDLYWLYRSQWTTDPMVHLLPMDWTDHEPGDSVDVWAYANVDTVELFLNGRSFGVRTFDHKTTTDGRAYLETTEPTGDDRTVGGGPFPGSYTSPNGSAGKLHLAWSVPFEPGALVAVASRDGVEVARDEITTAGQPAGLKLATDRLVIPASGASLAYVTVDIVDPEGVRVPGADALVDVLVSGGALVGIDNGRQESAEGYKASSHHAYHGTLVAIVRSTEDAGPITITARSPLLPPTTTTIYATDPIGAGLIAVEPFLLRAAVGSTPALPATVQAIHADGSQSAMAVTWEDLPVDAFDRSGITTVDGTVDGTSVGAVATITIYAPAGVETWSTVVPVGQPPRLPAFAHVGFDDGTDALVPVTWDAIDPVAYASAGQFAVRGGVAGRASAALGTIRVTDDVTPARDIARTTSPLRPTADASFSGSPTSLPAAMLDGDAVTGGWSNFYRKQATALLPEISTAHRQDWVSIAWPNPHTVDRVTAFFVADAWHALPAALGVSFWTGSEWRPVGDLAIDWSASSRGPTRITFDAVTTDRLRFAMTSPAPDTTSGFLGISELEVTGDVVAYQTTAALSDLQVAGHSVPGFDPGTTDYVVVTGTDVPSISVRATAAANGRLLIVPPTSLPGKATIIVTSEEGLATTTYSVRLEREAAGTSP